jgi:hypothetical protein
MALPWRLNLSGEERREEVRAQDLIKLLLQFGTFLLALLSFIVLMMSKGP